MDRSQRPFLLGWASWLALMVLSGSARTLAADEWTRLRGPGGHGLAAAPEKFAAIEDWTTRWTVELDIEGHSSPVVLENRVFLTGIDGDGTLALQRRSTKDGALEWSRALGRDSVSRHALNSDASASPTADSEQVYVTFTRENSLHLAAFDHRGGQSWQRELGPFAAQHGSGTSPIVVGEVVILGNDHESEGSCLLGIDRRSGETVWKRARESSRASYATPILFTAPSGELEVVFSSTSHGLTALDPRTGELAWEISLDFKERCVGGPALARGMLWQSAGSGGGGRESAVVRPPHTTAAGPAVLYRPGRALPYVPTPIGVGDRFFSFSDGGIVSGLDAETGTVEWQQRIENASFYGSPIAVGDRLLAMSKEGELLAVRASGRFELLGRIDLDEPSFATLAAVGDVLYARTLAHLHAIRMVAVESGEHP